MKAIDVSVEPSAVSDPELLKSEVADVILDGKKRYGRRLHHTDVFAQQSLFSCPGYTVRFYVME